MVLSSVKTSLQLESDLDGIPQLLSWFEQFKDAPIPTPIWLEGQMALLEGFTNAVRHAHQNLPTSTVVEIVVETDLQVCSPTFQIQIFDWGATFDLAEAWRQLSDMVNQPDFDPLDREAHWGMLMLLKLKNEHGWSMTYQRQEDQRNCLVMTRQWRE